MMNLYEVARFLEAHDNYDILTHAYPDGDTLGSGFALCLALRQIGKKARVITTGVPSKFTYLQKNIEEEDFTTETVVSVDVAADSLLGSNMGKYIGKVDLCIDHHGSNTFTAKEKFVDKYAAANCEILYKLFLRMNKLERFVLSICRRTTDGNELEVRGAKAHLHPSHLSRQVPRLV